MNRLLREVQIHPSGQLYEQSLRPEVTLKATGAQRENQGQTSEKESVTTATGLRVSQTAPPIAADERPSLDLHRCHRNRTQLSLVIEERDVLVLLLQSEDIEQGQIMLGCWNGKVHLAA